MPVKCFSGNRVMLTSSFISDKTLSHEENVELFQKIEALEQEAFRKVFSYIPFANSLVQKLKDIFLSIEEGNKFQDNLEFLEILSQDLTQKSSQKNFEEAIYTFSQKMIALDSPRELIRFVIGFPLCKDKINEFSTNKWKMNDVKNWIAEIAKLTNEANAIKNKIVASNQGLIGVVLKQYNYVKKDNENILSDIYQEGIFGLYRAIDKFEYRRGLRFTTYSNWWIRHSISRYVKENKSLIRTPEHIYYKKNIVKKFQKEFFEKKGRYPSIAEIRKGVTHRNIHMSEDTVRFIIEDRNVVVSGDSAIQNKKQGDEFVLWDTIADESSVDSAALLAKKALREELKKALSTLTEREQKIICNRFGFFSDEEETLQKIGDDMNLSRERIRQIERGALLKIKDKISSVYPTFQHYS